MPEIGRLLAVDDNEFNRDLLARRLRREGYQVELAADGYAALELIRSGRFDVILLDIMMPGLSGMELLSIIRREHSIAALPVIMTTARDQSADIVEGLRRGANDYVTKPIDMPVLLARIQTQLQLRRLSQLKDEFLSIASHDLKNPLSTVLMAAHILRERLPPGSLMQEQYYEMLAFIIKHSEEMQRIIRDFLDFQAVADGQLALSVGPVLLNDLLMDIITDNASYAEKKQISIAAELDPACAILPGDAARLRQVAQNLIGNAIKFCEPASTVLVRSFLSSDQAHVEVQDSGPGLTSDDMQQVFNKYSRLSNKPTGDEKSSGLGLAICKQMIELHGGQVGVRNNPNRGATFWFTLPVTAAQLSE